MMEASGQVAAMSLSTPEARPLTRIRDEGDVGPASGPAVPAQPAAAGPAVSSCRRSPQLRGRA